MQLFGLACVAAYCVVALLVAARMLRLAARTREAPELLIGSALLVGGGVAYPSGVASALLAGAAPALALRLAIGSTLGLFASAWAILLVWYVIYPQGVLWSRGVLAAVTLLSAVTLVDRLAGIDPAAMNGGGEMSAGFRISLVVQALPYALNAAAGLRYHALLQRRIPLGLADPVAANRILLWSVTSLLVVVQYAWSLSAPLLSRFFDAAAVSGAVIGSLGLSLAVLLTLAFFPPRAYLEWLAVRTRPA